VLQKMLDSVWWQNFDGGKQNKLLIPREISWVAAKYAPELSKLANRSGDQRLLELSKVAANKLRQCAGEMSRVPPKKCVSVLEKSPG
jgi:hypothetical protein